MKKLSIIKPTNTKTGLLSSELDQYVKNEIEQKTTKSYKSIFLEHVFTYFNLVNFALAILVALTGSYRNMLFLFVVLANMVIGLVQEIRSKQVLDKLALVYQDKVQVLRDGKTSTIPIDEIRLNELLVLKSGDQIPVDGVLVSGDCQVNESMLTGEADAIDEKKGDSLYAGCFLVAGQCMMQAVAVGDKTYMAGLLKQAKRSRRYPSSLRDALDKIIHLASYLIIPVGLALFIKGSLSGEVWQDAVLSSVAAMVGMIPEGLVILTSIALAAASVDLARKNVLVQELYCIETLARVNVLCLDKTGTITEGSMKVDSLEPFDHTSEKELMQILANVYLSSLEENATAQAIKNFLHANKCQIDEKPKHNFAFSSSIKAMGSSFKNEVIFIGAYTFLQEKPEKEVLKKIASYAKEGYRVLAVCKGPAQASLEKGNYETLGLIVLEDIIRPDAKEILDYFKKQDVEVKIISGDDPQTVAAIARKVGIEGKAVSMSDVDMDDLDTIVLEDTIFGRVTPDQKKEMVLALKRDGKTVAMTGDGVNDVLALKEADCSIAMGTGTQAARSIASLVLLKDQFEALPSILLQGRRVINNITRTASLFLVKTLFSFGIALLTIFWLESYPFEPIQLTLISSLATGIPSFILTLEPNDRRVEGSFLKTVLSKALPGACNLILAVLLAIIVRNFMKIDSEQFSTICTWLAGMNALGVLFYICLPLTTIRKVLVFVMSISFIAVFFLFPSFFYLVRLSFGQFILTVIMTAGLFVMLYLLFRLPWLKWLNKINL